LRGLHGDLQANAYDCHGVGWPGQWEWICIVTDAPLQIKDG